MLPESNSDSRQSYVKKHENCRRGCHLDVVLGEPGIVQVVPLAQ
jgi:hypothetical protein